ncbi:MAG: ABC transporter permease [Candidatus Methylomirabilis sp.]|nr:ABC transporter permease [Deltaproteobacteria bacterium]
MRFESRISERYLGFQSKGSLIRAISVISVAGIAVGVAVLVTVLAVITGFERELRAKIVGVNAHVIVLKYGEDMRDAARAADEVRALPGVRSVDPFIFNSAMLTASRRVKGVTVRGMDFAAVDRERRLRVNLAGAFPDDGAETPEIVLGEELATALRVGVGDAVNLVSPAVGAGKRSKIERFRVTGLFRVGMYEYDSSLALMTLGAARSFFGMEDRVTGLEVMVEDLHAARRVAFSIQEKLGFPYWTRDWMELNRNFFEALRLQKAVMFVILVLIVLVASFNLVSSLTMIVKEKRRDVAILRAMGARRSAIERIFAFQGMGIGLLGILLGLAGGGVLVGIIHWFPIVKLAPEVYFIDRLPVLVIAGDVAMVVGAALALAFFSSAAPARRASRLEPTDVFRYE